LCSTWAEIRYLWAFQPNLDGGHARSLRLNRAVRDLDFHQKTLLLDEFGIGFAAYYMTTFEQATEPVDAFIAKRRGQVRFRGNTRRSLPDYIFRGPGADQYFVVECKGSQSGRSTAIGQMQRSSEQVLTVDIDPPATVVRLVVAAWLQQAITVLVIDPVGEGGQPKLSHWSGEEISRFAHAKRLSYIGDQKNASALLNELVEPPPDYLVFEQNSLGNRITAFGNFVGSEQDMIMPDGRQARMFRGVQESLYDALVHDRKVSNSQLAHDGNREKRFFLETVTAEDGNTVRSVSKDGSLFEIRIS
jgi:hypothetical protein